MFSRHPTPARRARTSLVCVLIAAMLGVFAVMSSPAAPASASGASYLGSVALSAIRRPVTGMAATPSGRGYWLAADDGGVFSFGDAHFYGSTGAHPSQPADRRHGGHTEWARLLARRIRRRHLQLRRRALLRLHRRDPPQQADRRHGGDAERARLLARRIRRRRLQLRRRPLLRLHRRPEASTGPSSTWRRPGRGAATGWWRPTAASSASATRRSTAPPAARHCTRRSSASTGPGRPRLLPRGARRPACSDSERPRDLAHRRLDALAHRGHGFRARWRLLARHRRRRRLHRAAADGGWLPTRTTAARPRSASRKRSITAPTRSGARAACPALAWDAQLSSLAASWSSSMARTGSFSHRNLSSLFGSSSYSNRYRSLEENIYEGNGSFGTAGSAHVALMNSASHRAAMLNSGLTSLGVGAYCSGGTLYVTQDFGTWVSHPRAAGRRDPARQSHRAQRLPRRKVPVTIRSLLRLHLHDDARASSRAGLFARWRA